MNSLTLRNVVTVLGVAVLAVALVAAFAPSVFAGVGNGAPSGPHYNLNIIGVDKEKTADMDGNNGHRIFVPLWGKAKINLAEGDDFQVLDANGTDNDGAAFQLPNPDEDGDGTTEYSVYVRALGKPGGKATVQSCYTDEFGSEWCAVDFEGGVLAVELQRGKGQQKFENVSRDLLYVDVCTEWTDDNLNGVLDEGECDKVEQVPLFGEEAQGYFWDYNNKGLKLAQFRFYEVPTEVNFE